MPLETNPASAIIFLITIGVSLYALFVNQRLYENWIMAPWRVFNENRWHTLITSGFLHADLAHLAFNMMTFYFFAFQLEQTIGTSDFITVYFGSMILADISCLIKNKENPHYRTLGASGAIAGVLFSFILFYPTSKIMMFFIPIGIPAPIFAVLYLVYCYFAAKQSRDFINHDAHFWGAASGFILTVILQPESLEYFISEVLSFF